MLADLVVEGARTLAFVRSRRGAEVAALSAQRLLADVDAELVDRVAAYRGGYLPEERRALEAALAARRPPRGRDDQRARAGRGHRGPGRRGGGGLPGHAGLVLATGRPRRPGPRRGPRGARRPRRPHGHLPRAPSRRAARRARGGLRAEPRQPLRAGAPAGLRRGGAAADRRRPRRGVRRDRCRGGARRAGGGRGAAPPSRRVVLALHPGAPGGRPWTSADPGSARWPSSRRTPGGCSARSTPDLRPPRCTPAPSTCTAARATSCRTSTSTPASRWCSAAAPDWRTDARSTADVEVSAVLTCRERGPVRVAVRRGDGDHAGGGVPTAGTGRQGAGDRATRPAAADAAHPRGLVRPRRRRPRRRRGGSRAGARRAARRRARRHRNTAAVRDLRPLGHRRHVDRAAPGSPGARRSSSTTGTPAGRASRSGVTRCCRGGSPPPVRRSPAASAAPGAPRACSRRSAATATRRWTSRAPCGCWTSCCMRSAAIIGAAQVGRRRPARSGGGAGRRRPFAVGPVRGWASDDAPAPPQSGERHSVVPGSAGASGNLFQ